MLSKLVVLEEVVGVSSSKRNIVNHRDRNEPQNVIVIAEWAT